MLCFAHSLVTEKNFKLQKVAMLALLANLKKQLNAAFTLRLEGLARSRLAKIQSKNLRTRNYPVSIHSQITETPDSTNAQFSKYMNGGVVTAKKSSRGCAGGVPHRRISSRQRARPRPTI